jgi:hypothetical protein
VKTLLKPLRKLVRKCGFDVVRWRGYDPGKPPAELEEHDFETVRLVAPYTMTSEERRFALIKAVRYVVRANIPGSIVECGVWRGGSMMTAARTLLRLNDTTRDLYLFDTFEGMPPPSAHDVHPEGDSAAKILEHADKSSDVWAYATLDDVKKAMATVGYPSQRVHYVKGKVEDTIPGQAPDSIALLRLDTDWYESTKHELEHLYPRLANKGVLIIDDYGFWQGARKAVDEYLAANGIQMLLNIVDRTGGRIAVKVGD